MSFDWLYHPAEFIDEQLTAGLDGVGLVVVLLLAVALGLRHATDPDHLVAVTALVAGEEAGPRDAVRLGGWWGAGHSLMLLLLGLPLIASGSVMPPRVEQMAEQLIGLVIVLLAARVLVRWWRSRGADLASREQGSSVGPATSPRTAAQAVGIGVVHGLGGTGAVTLLLLSVLPDRGQAMLALGAFAPMSVVSMAACTGIYAWAIKRSGSLTVATRILTPMLGIFGVMFGTWYMGVV